MPSFTYPGLKDRDAYIAVRLKQAAPKTKVTSKSEIGKQIERDQQAKEMQARKAELELEADAVDLQITVLSTNFPKGEVIEVAEDDPCLPRILERVQLGQLEEVKGAPKKKAPAKRS